MELYILDHFLIFKSSMNPSIIYGRATTFHLSQESALNYADSIY